MQTRETVSAKDKMTASAVMNPALLEDFEAPAFSYDFECVGPREECRLEYLEMKAEISMLRAMGGSAERIMKLEEESTKMLEVKWRESIHNLVTTVGKTDIVDKYFKGSTYTAAWYMGLCGAGTKAVGDTLASHAGWTEQTPYSGNRPAITFGTTSAGSNTGTAVSYSITGSATVAGAFIASVNTGTSGTLYSAGDFAASRTVASGDTLNVTPTVSAS